MNETPNPKEVDTVCPFAHFVCLPLKGRPCPLNEQARSAKSFEQWELEVKSAKLCSFIGERISMFQFIPICKSLFESEGKCEISGDLKGGVTPMNSFGGLSLLDNWLEQEQKEIWIEKCKR